MNITMLAAGSRGDVQPFVALGQALKREGHNPTIVSHDNFADFVTGAGIGFIPLSGDLRAVMESEDIQQAMDADNPLRMLMSFNKLKDQAYDLQGEFFAASEGADAIVYHPGAAIGYYAARELGIPSILATPFPMTPTVEYPSIIAYDGPRLGRRYNLLTYRFIEGLLWMASKGNLKRYWVERFGELPTDFGAPFPKQVTAKAPTLISCSSHVFPLTSDWPDHVHLTGYWFMDADDWEPPADLKYFLESGEPPVYVGFGSLGKTGEAEKTTQIVLNALQMAGVRGLLASGWSGLSESIDLPESVFMLNSAPHSWLFPRMRAVVHHGGAGTTAAGLRAGVPAVVIPHGNDQPGWARRVYDLGVGSEPIPRKRLTAEALAEGIRYALRDEITEAARALGEKIDAEDGAANAAKIISETITRHTP